MSRRALAVTAGALVLGLLAGGAVAAAEQQRLVDRSRLVVESFLDDPELQKARVYVQNAYAVLVVPDLLKGGLFIGAQGGSGVLLSRDPQSGSWSEPAFYDLFGGSLGLQFGGQTADAIFTIMNQGAIRRILTSQFKLGADASAAIGPIGAGVGGGVTAQFGEDIYAFSRTKGLFGGLSLDGTWLRPKPEWNQAYYGQPVTPAQIVLDRSVGAMPDTQTLRDALARF